MVLGGPPVPFTSPAVSFGGPAVSFPGPAVSFAGPAVSFAGPGASFAGPAVSFAGPGASFAGSAVSLAGLARGGFRWPVAGARVVRRFDPPPRPWLPGHRGADLAAASGSVIRAAGAGVIVFSGQIAGRGVVSVAHPGGLRTTYEPVLVEPHSPGDPVAAGEEIGTLVPGHPGCPTAACLHWGLRRGAEYLDPLTLLGLGRVRLLPL
ncbi:murein hydrolase activator EnvC [Actinoplanes sp. ATCC 53533]|uniref:murein hydrolase activator EnvC family protein n=1 Tax=Actinoplanes sp. ATCC 53533 TaxID=1288362 RepID=UPI003515823F